jgi:hypothetical protein
VGVVAYPEIEDAEKRLVALAQFLDFENSIRHRRITQMASEWAEKLYDKYLKNVSLAIGTTNEFEQVKKWIENLTIKNLWILNQLFAEMHDDYGLDGVNIDLPSIPSHYHVDVIPNMDGHNLAELYRYRIKALRALQYYDIIFNFRIQKITENILLHRFLFSINIEVLNFAIDAATIESQRRPSMNMNSSAPTLVLQSDGDQAGEEKSSVAQLKISSSDDTNKNRKRSRPTKRIRPFHTDSGLGWERITIEFVSDEIVRITYPPTCDEQIHYSDIGFSDNRTTAEKPNIHWTMLLVLAKNNGKIAWTDKTTIPDQQKMKKHIQGIRDSLRLIFPDITGDPFLPYRPENAYQTRFRLTYSTRP